MELQKLNLPEYIFRIKTEGSKRLIFDSIRKKNVVLTPEEWVRQNFVQYLIQEKGYPESLMAIERQVRVVGRLRRFDMVVYDRSGQPWAVAEFKSYDVKITQESFDQVVRYNMALKVKMLFVSNGMQHFACEIDYGNNSYKYLSGIPDFLPG